MFRVNYTDPHVKFVLCKIWLLLLRKWLPKMEFYILRTGIRRELAFKDHGGWKYRAYEKPLAIMATRVTERTGRLGHRAVSDTRELRRRIDSLCDINIMRYPIYAIIGLRRIGVFLLTSSCGRSLPVNDGCEREFALGCARIAHEIQPRAARRI